MERQSFLNGLSVGLLLGGLIFGLLAYRAGHLDGQLKIIREETKWLSERLPAEPKT